MEYYARVCILSTVFTSRCVGKFFTSCLTFETSNFPMHLKVNTDDRIFQRISK